MSKRGTLYSAKVSITIFLPGLFAIGLAGCASQENLGSDFGDAVRHNQYVQLVNPAAGEVEALPATLDGQRAETVMDRYRKEKREGEEGRLLEDISGSSN